MHTDFGMYNSKIACGQYHSAMIAVPGIESKPRHIQLNRLFVWGQNDEGQLCDIVKQGFTNFKKRLDKPTEMKLMYAQQEYEAISVVAGPSYNLMIGQINLDYEKQMTHTDGRNSKWHLKQPLIMPEHTAHFARYPETTKVTIEKFRKSLKDILLKKGTLVNLFESHGQNGVKVGPGAAGAQNKNRTRNEQDVGYGNFFTVNNQQNNLKPKRNIGSRDRQQVLSEIDPTKVLIERDDFQDQLTEREIGTVLEIKEVTEVIYGDNNEISLGQLEDFALGFQQHAIKLFLYGKVDSKLVSFSNTIPVVKPEVNAQSEANSANSERVSNATVEEAKIAIISRPTVVSFPRFCSKVQQVACGNGHILALTGHQEMYSWGNGEYGALGFNTYESLLQPTPLSIRQNGQKLKIMSVVCGPQHSICLTTKMQIFTWGTGKNGRLGHGNQDDQLVPTEIQSLSNLRVHQVSAGESHCAALTQSKKVYLWGNGSYGRLGTGFEFTNLSPINVDDFDQLDIVKISCGAFHTLILGRDGSVYSFGHNKYGKLGTKEDIIFKAIYTQVVPYKCSDSADNKVKIGLDHKNNGFFKMIEAGYNHSLVVNSKGKVYSWGYAGLGLLGRDNRETFQNVPLQIETNFLSMDKKLFKVNLPPDRVLFSLKDSTINLKQSQSGQTLSTKIIKVQCVNLGTLALTDKGEVHYAGDKRYGQVPISDEEEKLEVSTKANETKPIFTQIKLIQPVKDIACGGDHIFAVTIHDRVFGWGKNDHAQLGLGILQDYMNKPQEVMTFRDKAINKIVCGLNYSAVITNSNRLMVAGSLEYGKLGLGTGHIDEEIKEFTYISLRSVKDVSCGPTHMLAIIDSSMTNESGAFSCGNNSFGQLGTDDIASSFLMKEIQLARGDKLAQVCAGLDFSVGLSKIANKVYVWGNVKYLCAKSRETILKAPVLVKDLQNEKVKAIFSSQTQVYVVTEDDVIRSWGEWFYDRARENIEEEQSSSDDEAVDESHQNQSVSSDEDLSEDSPSYNTSSERESDSEEIINVKTKQTKKRKNKRQGGKKDFFELTVFPEKQANNHLYAQDDQFKLTQFAFGINHCAAVGSDNLLYTWGHNWTQEMGISLDQYDDTYDGSQPKLLRNRVHSAALNKTLTDNQTRLEEEAIAVGMAGGLDDDIGSARDDDENNEYSQIGGADGEEGDADEEGANQRRYGSGAKGAAGSGVGEGGNAGRSGDGSRANGATSGGASFNEEGAGGTAGFQSYRSNQRTGGDGRGGQTAGSRKNVSYQDGYEDGDTTRPEQIQLLDKKKNGAQSSSAQTKQGTYGRPNLDDSYQEQIIALKPVQEIGEFPKVPPKKKIRVNNPTYKFEQNIQVLQGHLKDEKRWKRDEENMFSYDKDIQDAFKTLIKQMNKLPELERERVALKVMIKNSLLQRFNEKPLNLPPAINFDGMKAQKFIDRKTRREYKSGFKNILRLLHLHPCYFIRMYESGEFKNEELLDYFKIIYPSKSLENVPFGDNTVDDATPLVKREQERVNLLLISFIKQVIPHELEEMRLRDIDFTKEDSLIGKLFYRIFKSQERNMDTICSILAHLLDKFIVMQLDGATYESKEDKQKRGGNAKQDVQNREQDPSSDAAVKMYMKMIEELIQEIMDDKVLDEENSQNFKLNNEALSLQDKDSLNLHSLRFSSEVNMLIQVVIKELNRKKNLDIQAGRANAKGKNLNDEDFMVAQKIFGLIFYRPIKKITTDSETLRLYLDPYLKEAKKQILIDEGMNKQGEIFLELCNTVNFFFSDNYEGKEKEGREDREEQIQKFTGGAWDFYDFRQSIEKLRREKMSQIFQHSLLKNNSSAKLLSIQQFENVMFHSLKATDYMLTLKRDTLVSLFENLVKFSDRIAFTQPLTNDELYIGFKCGDQLDPSEDGNEAKGKKKEKRGVESKKFKEFIASLKTYPEKFKMKIPTRMFVSAQNLSIRKCKVCQTVLTDEFTVLESLQVIQQYTPEDKESLVYLFCYMLKETHDLRKDKNFRMQLQEQIKLYKNSNDGLLDDLPNKYREFQQNMDREIFMKKNQLFENITTQADQIEEQYNEMRHKIFDWEGFESHWIEPGEEEVTIEAKLRAITYIQIYADVIFETAQKKINGRQSHKDLSQILLRRFENELHGYFVDSIESIRQNEIFPLQVYLFNCKLGIGNIELRKMPKHVKEVTQMKSIIDEQENQNYSKILYEVLPAQQKLNLRAIVKKSGKELVKNRVITRINKESLKPMIRQCRLEIMEDEQRDILVKLLYVQRKYACLCIPQGKPNENLLIQFQLSQKQMVEIRKSVKAYQTFAGHVHLAFDNDDLNVQNQMCKFAQQMEATATGQNVNNNQGGNKKKKQKVKKVESREQALQCLSIFNKRLFKECIEFDLSKLLEMIDEMLRMRQAYIFTGEKTPKELLEVEFLANQRKTKRH